MKVKNAAQTAALGKGHRYLGHFKKDKYINEGHNSLDPFADAMSSTPDIKKFDDDKNMSKLGAALGKKKSTKVTGDFDTDMSNYA